MLLNLTAGTTDPIYRGTKGRFVAGDKAFFTSFDKEVTAKILRFCYGETVKDPHILLCIILGSSMVGKNMLYYIL